MHASSRLFRVRNGLAAALLALGLVGYPIGWSLDPYVFGVMLLGLGPVQIGVSILGALVRIVGADRRGTLAPWIIDALLLATAVSGYLWARTISWT